MKATFFLVFKAWCDQGRDLVGHAFICNREVFSQRLFLKIRYGMGLTSSQEGVETIASQKDTGTWSLIKCLSEDDEKICVFEHKFSDDKSALKLIENGLLVSVRGLSHTTALENSTASFDFEVPMGATQRECDINDYGAHHPTSHTAAYHGCCGGVPGVALCGGGPCIRPLQGMGRVLVVTARAISCTAALGRALCL